jgi:hypothetical protein
MLRVASSSDSAAAYVRQQLVELPVGLRGEQCSNCGKAALSGAVFVDRANTAAVQGADAADPSIVCLYCGHWCD